MLDLENEQDLRCMFEELGDQLTAAARQQDAGGYTKLHLFVDASEPTAAQCAEVATQNLADDALVRLGSKPAGASSSNSSTGGVAAAGDAEPRALRGPALPAPATRARADACLRDSKGSASPSSTSVGGWSGGSGSAADQGPGSVRGGNSSAVSLREGDGLRIPGGGGRDSGSSASGGRGSGSSASGRLHTLHPQTPSGDARGELALVARRLGSLSSGDEDDGEDDAIIPHDVILPATQPASPCLSAQPALEPVRSPTSGSGASGSDSKPRTLGSEVRRPYTSGSEIRSRTSKVSKSSAAVLQQEAVLRAQLNEYVTDLRLRVEVIRPWELQIIQLIGGGAFGEVRGNGCIPW